MLSVCSMTIFLILLRKTPVAHGDAMSADPVKVRRRY